MNFFVYILASKRNGTLYIGMTDNLVRRIWEHRSNVVPGFTRKYNVKTLVWFEHHETRESALIRERQPKNGNAPGNCSLLRKPTPHGAIYGMKSMADAFNAPFIPAQAGIQ